MGNNTFWSSSYKETVKAKIDVNIDLTDTHIFNWLVECQNPETLKYLGKAALKFAHDIENKEEESWHSDVLG